MHRQISIEDAREAMRTLGIDQSVVPANYLQKGMQVELEHGSSGPRTNVTGDDLSMTAKIAMAHINEFPDYYKRLEVLEKEADAYWKGKQKPYSYSDRQSILVALFLLLLVAVYNTFYP